MRILAVDDERLMLQALVDSIREAAPDSEPAAFLRPSEALEYASSNPVDVAFLDIHMRGMDGLELARELQKQYPSINIIFCTGYEEYLSEAFRSVRCNGYVYKPVDAEAIRQELAHLRVPVNMIPARTTDLREGLQVRCFGWFEVFYNGKPVVFKRQKTKELLAYLVDLRGASADTRSICGALWPETPTTEKETSHFRHLVADLKQTLAQYDCSDIFLQNRNSYAVDIHALSCDYYDYLDGDESAKQYYYGDYMLQYEWAEMSTGWKY